MMDTNNLQPIWTDSTTQSIHIIDQRHLPHEVHILTLETVDDVITAIAEMAVRGAPLIGVTGAYGVYLALKNARAEKTTADDLLHECSRITSVRPTAVNLAWAVDAVLSGVLPLMDEEDNAKRAFEQAKRIEQQEIENCRKIGEHGLPILKKIARQKQGGTVNILTHCNAGWLACVQYGTATAPIYAAHNAGIKVHVWVDETRPLNQGARLTAWELGKSGVPHTVICDNTGGHLMQHKLVDLVLVGTDRTTHTGDVANKIGTYLKALAAKDNEIPFYVALPSSTFDWTMTDGRAHIHIETRDPDEVRYVQGLDDGKIRNVLVMPNESPAMNYAFDVTPARLVTGFITERGVCSAGKADILRLFPEKRNISANHGTRADASQNLNRMKKR
ncbi:MAG: S-methyl-5-thioribose-1-phosphate isomerase [Desulfobacterales bacterium]